jgi:hypothetical protein
LILGSKLVHWINSTVLFEAALIGKPVIAEGECLLNHPYQDMDTVTAAIVASQYPVRGPFGVFCKGFMPLNTNDPKSVEQVGYA